MKEMLFLDILLGYLFNWKYIFHAIYSDFSFSFSNVSEILLMFSPTQLNIFSFSISLENKQAPKMNNTTFLKYWDMLM